MSVATQIERIKTNIANAYTSAQAKGATIPQTQNSENLAACVQSIATGSGGSTQFGLTAEQMVGTADTDGNLTYPTLPSITFTGFKYIPDFGYRYKFFQRNFETGASVAFPDLTNVAINSMDSCFGQSPSLTSVDLSALTTVGASGMASCFYLCTSLTSVDLSALTTVDTNGLYYCFHDCESLTSVDLSSLTSVGRLGLSYCFGECASLTTISFPALTDVQTDSFGGTNSYCFRNCTALTEIHFRADMQTTIEAMTGYADKWGATGATIYFDL